MALTEAEIKANVRAVRSVVGTSSSPLGGLLPVDFSQRASTSLVPAKPAARLTPVPSSLMRMFILRVSLGRGTGLPLA